MFLMISTISINHFCHSANFYHLLGDDELNSLLLIAAWDGYAKDVSNLILKGASPFCKDKHGWTALMFMCSKGYADLCASLLRTISEDYCTYDIDYDDGESESNVSIDRIKMKQSKSGKPSRGDRVDANYRGRGEWFPGKVVKDKGRRRLKRYVNAQESLSGWTAMHIACVNGHPSCVELLCSKYKANLTTKSDLGETAEDCICAGVLDTVDDFFCPITKTQFKHVLKNPECKHRLSKEGLEELMLETGKTFCKCPFPGCAKTWTRQRCVHDKDFEHSMHRFFVGQDIKEIMLACKRSYSKNGPRNRPINPALRVAQNPRPPSSSSVGESRVVASSHSAKRPMIKIEESDNENYSDDAYSDDDAKH